MPTTARANKNRRPLVTFLADNIHFEWLNLFGLFDAAFNQEAMTPANKYSPKQPTEIFPYFLKHRQQN